ncbi:MAG: DUF4215 domain-containing protein [Myxococcales bacterium]|nr:DUF4215 domain-containing protein [Myxococcales bacterium]
MSASTSASGTGHEATDPSDATASDPSDTVHGSDSDGTDGTDATDDTAATTDDITATDTDATTAPTDATTDPTDATTDPTDATTDSTETDGCPEGQLECPCGPMASCDDGLVCEADVCVPGAICGDGALDPGEGCDDGNLDGGDGCSPTCTLESCGNGITDPGEACDDGMDGDNDDGCTDLCAKPSCGDGFVQQSLGEACDDGPQNNDGAACTLACAQASCGDGKLWVGEEECDDGNGVNTDACLASCAAASCGDGFVWSGQEECDDGNGVNNDLCSNTCTLNEMGGEDPCGFADDDGVWIDIDYEDAFTVTSPDYSYSPTPAWQEPEWTPTQMGYFWPKVVDLYNNMTVDNDPIGKLAVIKSNSTLRLYFGTKNLWSYTSATVCVTGRSVSVSSPVTFQVINPANGDCGASAMMSHDWTVHASGVTMPANCIIPNHGFQAIDIDATGGSAKLGVRSVRLTLHGAQY